MTLAGTLVESKMENNNKIIHKLKAIFYKNWEKTCVIDGVNERELSYADLFHAMLNGSEWFYKQGVKRGDVVCLVMHNSLELLVLYFSALLAGVTVVPIDPEKSSGEINEILVQLNCRTIISDHSLPAFEHIRFNTVEQQSLYSERTEDVNALTLFETQDYNSPFIVTVTSGSTGVPKGVIHSFINLALSADAFAKRFDFGKKHTFYHNLPMTYMAGILNQIFLPFLSESKIVIGERFSVVSIMRFWDIPIKYSVNVFWSIPTILSMLIKLDRGVTGANYLGSNEVIICVGTAPLSAKVRHLFEEKYSIILYESYGLSETLFVSTQSPNNLSEENNVGSVLEGVNLSFAQDNEILVSVPWMFLGYVAHNVDGYFIGEKYKTGDFGASSKVNGLTITGRKKDIIIRGGVNIAPTKIVNVVESFGFFEEFAIAGLEDMTLGEKVVCFYVANPRVLSQEKENIIKKEVFNMLGKAYSIDNFFALESMPKNMNGKIDTKQLRSIYKKGTV